MYDLTENERKFIIRAVDVMFSAGHVTGDLAATSAAVTLAQSIVSKLSGKGSLSLDGGIPHYDWDAAFSDLNQTKPESIT
jgi:hypothetical protein